VQCAMHVVQKSSASPLVTLEFEAGAAPEVVRWKKREQDEEEAESVVHLYPVALDSAIII
jgi:hypothetical protein